MSICNVYMLLY